MNFKNTRLRHYQRWFYPGAYDDRDFEIIESPDREETSLSQPSESHNIARFFSVVEGEVEIDGQFVEFRSEPFNESHLFFVGGGIAYPQSGQIWHHAKANNRGPSENINRIWISPNGTFYGMRPEDKVICKPTNS